MSDMHEVRQALLTGERAEFQASGKRYIDTIFDDGESPLKHAHDIELKSSSFKWKYPLWYCSDILAKDCTWFEMARAGVWYTNTIRVEDCIWNCENVTVRDSFISGEYLAWNSRNVTFENCTIESLQGLCYVDNLVLRNCRLINTTLAFEYSNVDADIHSTIDSVFNPSSGTIRADVIKELTLDPMKIDPNKVTIITDNR